MHRSILLSCAVLLAACGADAGEPPPAQHGAAAPADTSLEGTPIIGVVPEVRARAQQAEAEMAARAREAEEQARQAEDGASQP